MGSVLSGGQTCSTQAEQHHAGSASGSTFDTSLQRTQQMGISPLHL